MEALVQHATLALVTLILGLGLPAAWISSRYELRVRRAQQRQK